jgi:hypothetical protein
VVIEKRTPLRGQDLAKKGSSFAHKPSLYFVILNGRKVTVMSGAERIGNANGISAPALAARRGTPPERLAARRRAA